MVLNFRSTDEQFFWDALLLSLTLNSWMDQNWLGCSAMKSPTPPMHCTLLEQGPYAGPRMDALRFFFFPGKWQQRLIPSVSGTQHSSLRKWHLFPPCGRHVMS